MTKRIGILAHRRLRPWLVVIASLACSGGDKPTEPPAFQITGRYVLESVGGRTVPVMALNLPGRRYFILYDSVTIENGQFRQDYAYRDVNISDGTIVDQPGTSSIAYRANRDTLFLQTTPARVDTSFATANGLRSMVTDPTRWWCPDGRCEYFFRRLP
jgi:hypothetical protein